MKSSIAIVIKYADFAMEESRFQCMDLGRCDTSCGKFYYASVGPWADRKSDVKHRTCEYGMETFF